MASLKQVVAQSTFKKGIIVPSLLFILLVTFASSFFPTPTATLLGRIQDWIFVDLNWMYVWAVTIFVVFLLGLVFSKYGAIKLGDDDSVPEYSFFSWISMLFAAGMGIGLMYFSVSEPIAHFSDPAFQGLSETQRAKDAQLYTFFHWGIHAWAIYAVVGLSLAYFTFRYKLPFSLRSCFYPILKNRINGVAGDAIDTFALCSTFFGITTTLGFGVAQLNAGLVEVGLLPGKAFGYQIVIVCLIMAVAITSATAGVNKGVKLLSQLNIVSVVALMLFVLLVGPTVFLLGTFSEGIGYYIREFFSLTFNTHAYEPEVQPWYFRWTILYWAWWISWSPFVGMFIAGISRGRTIREFICAVLLIPTVFNFLWMTVFGNSAIWLDRNVTAGLLGSVRDDADKLLFKFLSFFPAASFSSILTLFIILVFFVTSADSGILVMNSISSGNAAKSPKWQLVFWGVLLSVLALVLLNAGGLQALQTMTLITALPFAVIMLLFCYSLVQGLIVDNYYHTKEFSPAASNWSGEFWKHRLQRMLSTRNEESVNDFMQQVVRPALEELAQEFNRKGTTAILTSAGTPGKPTELTLTIEHKQIENFIYGVRNQSTIISSFLANEDNVPNVKDTQNHLPMTYFGGSRPGYNIEYFTKNEIIADVLKQYERFLTLSAEVKNEIFTDSTLKRVDE